MVEIRWQRYPKLAGHDRAAAWLKIQAQLGLAANTVEAYGRALDDYLSFCFRLNIDVNAATREHIALYVNDLTNRPGPHGPKIHHIDSRAGLANATIQQRLTAIRLYYDYLMEENLREINPVGRGRYTQGRGFGGKRERGLIPRFRKLPWIPNDEEWRKILAVTKCEPLRNRLMFAIAYDAGLRREELCLIETSHVDPTHHLIRIPAENTKGRHERIVPYSESTSILYANYLKQRSTLSRARGPLFLSESRRNCARPISLWTWSKVMEGIAKRANLPRLTTHTLRHLCLTDLARAGWDIHLIARFAGHRNFQSTLQYLHLSGRELSEKLQRGMAEIHAWRVRMMAEEFK